MPNRFNVGCGCCGCESIFTDDFDFPDDVIDPAWTQSAGAWSIGIAGFRVPLGGFAPFHSLFTTADSAKIIAKEGAEASREVSMLETGQGQNFIPRISCDKQGSTFGLMVGVLDADNYIYLKITNPTQETSEGAGDGIAATLDVIDVQGGAEANLGGPFTGLVTPTIGVGNFIYENLPLHHAFKACTISGVAAGNPVVQIIWEEFPGSTESFQQEFHVCLVTLYGSGFGFRTESLGGEIFAASGNFNFTPPVPPNTSFHYIGPNKVSDLLCQCICRCGLCTEAAPPPEVSLALTGWGTGGVCDQLNDYSPWILKCITEEEVTVFGSGGSECKWGISQVDTGLAINICLTLLYRPDQDDHVLKLVLSLATTGGLLGCSAVATFTGTTSLGSSSQDCWLFDQVFSSFSVGQGTVCTSVGTATVSVPAVTGCP